LNLSKERDAIDIALKKAYPLRMNTYFVVLMILTEEDYEIHEGIWDEDLANGINYDIGRFFYEEEQEELFDIFPNAREFLHEEL
jgi:hypothetical protein